MSEAIKMPALGESVTEGTITTWLKAVGDTVELDEPIVEVSTDKVDTEVPSPVAGVLTQILVPEDETVDVGTVLAYVGTTAELSEKPHDATPKTPTATVSAAALASQPISAAMQPQSVPPVVPAPAAPHPAPANVAAPTPTKAPTTSGTPASVASVPPAPAPAPAPAAQPTTESPSTSSESTADIASASNYVTPIVRKLAKELGVDLATVKGSGVGGRIRRQDVTAAAAKAAAAAKPAARTPKDASSGAGALGAQYPALVLEIDATRLVDDYFPQVLKVAAEELETHSALNAGNSVAFGITLTATRGAFMPVLRGLADKQPEEIRAALTDVTSRASRAEIGPDDLFGSTISIVDNTAQNILLEVPRIQHTHVAALSVGPASLRPAVVDAQGTVAARRKFFLSLSYDPTAADANVAATFLNAIQAKLEK